MVCLCVFVLLDRKTTIRKDELQRNDAEGQWAGGCLFSEIIFGSIGPLLGKAGYRLHDQITT